MDAQRAEHERVIVDRVVELLASGPQTTESLAFALHVEGVFRSSQDAGVAGLDTDLGRQAYLRELLLLSGSVWHDEGDPDALNHRCDHLFDGRVLTHRLTEREVRGGLLIGQLETTGHDFGIEPEDRPFGPDVDQHYDPQLRELTWNGSQDWLAEWNAGDLLAVSRRGAEFHLALVAPWELSDGRVEIAALSDFAETLTAGVSYDDFDLLPKVFASDPSVFTRPSPPLPELLVRAGIEVRDGYYGLAREPWSPPGALHPETDIEELVVRFELEDCCRKALDGLITAWLDLRVTPQDAASFDYREMAEKLSHDSVASAFEAWSISMGVLDADPYLEVLYNVAAIALPSAAGAHFLLARSLFRRREVLSGVRALDRALSADATYAPADEAMASVDFYLGNFDRSEARLARHGITLDESTSALYPETGNQEPRAPHDSLMAKAHWFLRSESCRSQVSMARVLAFGERADHAPAEHDFVMDLLLIEGGVFEKFLREYFPLLPPEEVRAGEHLTTTSRELFEVVAAEQGTPIEVSRVRDGARLESAESGPLSHTILGQHFLARTVGGAGGLRIEGPVLLVDAQQRRVLLDVLEFCRREPSSAMREMLDWFATARTAPPLEAFDEE